MLTSLVEPVEPRRLGIARTVIGVAAAARALVALPVLLDLAEPGIIKAPNFAWFPEPTTALAYALVGLWLTSAVMVAIGWKLNWFGPLLVGCLVFMLALDLQTYSNHLYLMVWLVLLLTVADASAGFTRFGESRMVPRWPILLMCLQISLVYFFSATTKLNEDFLSGRVLAGVLNDGLVPFPEGLRTPSFLGVLAGAAVVTELFIAFGLWVPRVRPIAYLAGVALHLPMVLFLGDTAEILIFAMMMLAVYPLFAVVRPGVNGTATA